jgi:hypothetical protein
VKPRGRRRQRLRAARQLLLRSQLHDLALPPPASSDH